MPNHPHLKLSQLNLLKVCPLKLRFLKLRFLKVCPLKLCLLKLCLLKVCLLKVRFLKACLLKVLPQVTCPHLLQFQLAFSNPLQDTLLKVMLHHKAMRTHHLQEAILKPTTLHLFIMFSMLTHTMEVTICQFIMFQFIMEATTEATTEDITEDITEAVMDSSVDTTGAVIMEAVTDSSVDTTEEAIIEMYDKNKIFHKLNIISILSNRFLK